MKNTKTVELKNRISRFVYISALPVFCTGLRQRTGNSRFPQKKRNYVVTSFFRIISAVVVCAAMFYKTLNVSPEFLNVCHRKNYTTNRQGFKCTEQKETKEIPCLILPVGI